MPNQSEPLADGQTQQALQFALYVLRQQGWTIDLADADRNGARLAAHKDSPLTVFTDARNLRDLEE